MTAAVRPPAPMRGWQEEAYAAVRLEIAGGGRTQVHAACGTGKTMLAVHAAYGLAPEGLIVGTYPSVALIAQNLAVWSRQRPDMRVLAVCSDDTVSGDVAVHVEDLPCEVTTSVEVVVDWLRRAAGRPVLVCTTFASAAVVAQALREVGASAGLLIVDEARRPSAEPRRSPRWETASF